MSLCTRKWLLRFLVIIVLSKLEEAHFILLLLFSPKLSNMDNHLQKKREKRKARRMKSGSNKFGAD